jgi:hypothetical protein
MTAILAASYHALGDDALAQKFAQDLRNNAPRYPELLRRMYTYKEDADEIIDRYQAIDTGS